MIREHIVKCWPVYFDAIDRGDKPFDVRRDDRGYQKGDILVLKKFEPRGKFGANYVRTDGTWSPRNDGSDAHTIKRQISFILTGGQFGIEPGYVVLGLLEIANR